MRNLPYGLMMATNAFKTVTSQNYTFCNEIVIYIFKLYLSKMKASRAGFKLP
jgi:hypothetical protein